MSRGLRLFNWLRSEGIDFITYQRGTPALEASQFQRRRATFDGGRVWMSVAEDTVAVAKSGPWRRIVMRTESGHQTPILTSLPATVSAVKIACLMFARWRQENYFKYAKEHHGIDGLIGYSWSEADASMLVPNPELWQLRREQTTRRRELRDLKAQLADQGVDSAGAQGKTRATTTDLLNDIRLLNDEIAALKDLIEVLPSRISVEEAGPRHVLGLEQKAITDRVKMTAYNAEEWLLERPAAHYVNHNDVRALLREFAKLSGVMTTSGNSIAITLDAPDTPAHRRALRGLCSDLTRLQACYPDTDLALTYSVATHPSELPTHHPEAAA